MSSNSSLNEDGFPPEDNKLMFTEKTIPLLDKLVGNTPQVDLEVGYIVQKATISPGDPVPCVGKDPRIYIDLNEI